jgi:hypothetical protein
MIQNRVAASRNVGCTQARRLMHELLGGSEACYPHGYTAHPKCTLERFRCSAAYTARTGITKGRCVKARKVITGTAGP